jgi:hypothetical protein
LRRPLFEPVEEVVDMNRRWFAVIAVCIGAVLALATSAAGGGAVFDFDSDYYVPGDTVTGSTAVGFEGGTFADFEKGGPFFGLLFRSGRDFRRESATLLGPIAFDPRGDGNVAIARISFTVPDVRPGLYEIATCNEDCSIRWIGDLVGGWFTVVATREEIPFRELEDRLTERIRTLQGRLQMFRDRLVDVETQANNAASDGQLAVNSGRDLDATMSRLQAELARLRDESGSLPLAELAGWFAAGLMASLGVALLVAHQRRRPELIIQPEDAGPAVAEDDLWRPADEPELVTSGRR